MIHFIKIKRTLRRRLNDAISGKTKKAKRTLELLGCDIKFLKEYLESKFYDRKDATKMSWENYGLYGWHIDHIRPCSSFDLSDPKQQETCFHYTNLQPLWSEDNYIKRDNIIF